MFVPTYQGLAATDFFKPGGGFRGMFPFTAPGNLRFYRARNAIYYLFKELRASSPQLTVLAPDYHSGNEVLALRAAGAAVHYYPIHRDMRLDPDEVRRLCEKHNPDVLYVIHYLAADAGARRSLPRARNVPRRILRARALERG